MTTRSFVTSAASVALGSATTTPSAMLTSDSLVSSLVDSSLSGSALQPAAIATIATEASTWKAREGIPVL